MSKRVCIEREEFEALISSAKERGYPELKIEYSSEPGISDISTVEVSTNMVQKEDFYVFLKSENIGFICFDLIHDGTLFCFRDSDTDRVFVRIFVDAKIFPDQRIFAGCYRKYRRLINERHTHFDNFYNENYER